VSVDINHPRLDHLFHYLVPEHMGRPEIGTHVRVPFGAQTLDGWIVGYSLPPGDVKMREIKTVVDPVPELTAEQLDLARWMGEYYIHPLSDILKMMTPPVKPKRAAAPVVEAGLSRRLVIPELTDEQKTAVTEITNTLQEHSHKAYLLHGVTGSGKTEVYLRSAATATAMGRQVLYLVPEIALTPQASLWFRRALGEEIAIWHSQLARGEKYRIWDGIRSGVIQILIGARSAVFAPFKDLGLIIIDEEHDPSYKQQNKPFYHAAEVAQWRAEKNQAVLVRGSATPSLESYTAARAGRSRLLTMNHRPSGRHLPQVSLVDLRSERQDGNYGLLSQYLVDGIQHRLLRHEQVILFLNRRGYAPLIFCSTCGQVLKCRHCSISLVYHQSTRDLRCHYCNEHTALPDRCPHCGSTKKLTFLGTGIQRVEQDLRRLFPAARLQRMDMDTTRPKGAVKRILGGFASRETDILLGTQMVTKGHDFPWVTLVGVLNADQALNLPDYRAAERTYQLLTQVSGRSGRGEIPGEVIVQTYFPDHYSILAASHQDYLSFYQEEAQSRRFLGYPPFGQLIRFRLSGEQETEVQSLSQELAGELREIFPGEEATLLGPAPAPILRVQELYRWQVTLKGSTLGRHNEICQCLRRLRKSTSVIISVEVDPYGF
jgi:primosomal protein N' (replication factor Y)